MDDPIESFAAARVARLATVDAQGAPHLVPLVFAMTGGVVYSCVDHKPKTTTALRRLRNIVETGRACLLADHYDDDWSHLWWVRVDGAAEVLASGTPGAERGIDALAAKYPQYVEARPNGPVIVVRDLRFSSWSA